jgi:hypothetical protein
MISTVEYDYVVITINERSEQGCKKVLDVRDQLLGIGVPLEKILLNVQPDGNDLRVEFPRREFLKNISQDFRERAISGAVAECGVCWGDFAEHINSMFPDKTLYLFDTFSSFDERDIAQETGSFPAAKMFLQKHLAITANPELVYIKCPNKSRVKIIRGYVPDTFLQIEDTEFCFVNLDMDLYAPTISSLHYFRSRMIQGGVILVHDYYHDYYHDKIRGVKRAVDEFLDAKGSRFVKTPIGDTLSVAIISV